MIHEKLTELIGKENVDSKKKNRLNDNPLFRSVLETHLQKYHLPQNVSEDDLNFYVYEPKEPSVTIEVVIAVPYGARGTPAWNNCGYCHYQLMDSKWERV